MPIGIATRGRSCGSWTYDAVYHGYGLGRGGVPIQNYVRCPAIPIDIAKLNIASRGVTLLPAEDPNHQGDVLKNPKGEVVYDIFDIVGENNYPYCADFYTEVKRLGFSRKLSKFLPWHMLTPGMSMHWIISGQAVIDPAQVADVGRDMGNCAQHKCLRGIPRHSHPWPSDFTDTCSQTWWHTIAEKDCQRTDNWLWERVMKSGDRYECHPTRLQLDFSYGIFMAFPLKANTLFSTTMAGSNNLSPEMQEAMRKMQAAGFEPRKEELEMNMGDLEDEDN